MVADRAYLQDAGKPGFGAARLPPPVMPRGMNGTVDPRDIDENRLRAEKQIKDILSVHAHVLDGLNNSGMDFVKTFTSTIYAHTERPYEFKKDEQLNWEWIFLPRPDGRTIIHQIIELVGQGKLDPGTAESFTKALIQIEPEMIVDRIFETRENALELAVSFPNCQGIIEVICEYGMVHVAKESVEKRDTGEDKRGTDIKAKEPRVSQARAQPSKTLGESIQQSNRPSSFPMPPGKFSESAVMSDDQGYEMKTIERDGNIVTVQVEWKQMKEAGRDTCLHTAIKKNSCARYLLQRMHLTGEQESLLSHPGQNGLTPLHVAVDYKKCSEERVELVKYIIEIYPRALSLRSVDPQVMAEYDEASSTSTRASSRVKDSQSPYKHFLESKENNNSRYAVYGDQPLAKGTKEAAEKMKEFLRLGCMRHHGHDRALIIKLLDTQVSLIAALQITNL
jgi:Ankyrin repeats (3 copies)